MPQVIPHNFLFRYAVLVPQRDAKARQRSPVVLTEDCRLPVFGMLDGESPFADVRLAWNKNGLIVRAKVAGKQHPPACITDPDRVEESDGLQIWIDTRPSGTVHRATRFCHQFCFLPTGGGKKQEEPFGIQLPISQAREDAAISKSTELQVCSEIDSEGYEIQATLLASQLTGFDPDSSRQLGFYYCVRDSELGEQFLSVSREFPVMHDPSLWITATLSD